ncbi:hypothetical protein WN55_03711 [Dufourea novaeangliae]|uniref:Uncharacterized protein n=1 Tax=Dufourea novaeangliae TaxID=178035 RepID=A0A154PK76_DUFNO|nr:hypothetical protein WN55_03711 [Dufourea novaeangliae]
MGRQDLVAIQSIHLVGSLGSELWLQMATDSGVHGLIQDSISNSDISESPFPAKGHLSPIQSSFLKKSINSTQRRSKQTITKVSVALPETSEKPDGTRKDSNVKLGRPRTPLWFIGLGVIQFSEVLADQGTVSPVTRLSDDT